MTWATPETLESSRRPEDGPADIREDSEASLTPTPDEEKAENHFETGAEKKVGFRFLSCKIILIESLPGNSLFFLFIFLDATTHLYKRSCPSVRPSVGP